MTLLPKGGSRSQRGRGNPNPTVFREEPVFRYPGSLPGPKRCFRRPLGVSILLCFLAYYLSTFWFLRLYTVYQYIFTLISVTLSCRRDVAPTAVLPVGGAEENRILSILTGEPRFTLLFILYSIDCEATKPDNRMTATNY